MRWVKILPIFLALMLVLGLAATANAETPELTILTAFTDTGSTTWAPSVVLIDQDAVGNPGFITFNIKNVSAEDFGFVIDELGVNRLVPRLDEMSIPIPIDKPGLYPFYSDMHNLPMGDPNDWVPGVRSHVAGWVLIGSPSQGDTFYLDVARSAGKILGKEIKVLRAYSMHPKARHALVEECEGLMKRVSWATKAVWNPESRVLAAKPAAYGQIYTLVHDEIQPTLMEVMNTLGINQSARSAMLKRSLKNLNALQHLIAEIQPVSTFGDPVEVTPEKPRTMKDVTKEALQRELRFKRMDHREINSLRDSQLLDDASMPGGG